VEARRSEALYLELVEGDTASYRRAVLPGRLAAPGVQVASLWRNQCPDRSDYERTIPEFETLAVYEVGTGFEPPAAQEGVRGHHFRRVDRPAQGSLSGRPTLGLELVLVSPRTSGGAGALRDWADFLHIREIASAAVPGLTMITPYEDAAGGEPRFLHLYEIDTPDAEAAFREMAPLTIARLKPRGKQAVRDWMGHPELRIDYVNSFTRIGEFRP